MATIGVKLGWIHCHLAILVDGLNNEVDNFVEISITHLATLLGILS